jgi:hypothetical protein
MAGSYEEWYAGRMARMERQVAERQAATASARGEWVHRRVWYSGPARQGYAWVESIGERGEVHLLFEDAPDGGLASAVIRLDALGSAITHAE